MAQNDPADTWRTDLSGVVAARTTEGTLTAEQATRISDCCDTATSELEFRSRMTVDPDPQLATLVEPLTDEEEERLATTVDDHGVEWRPWRMGPWPGRVLFGVATVGFAVTVVLGRSMKAETLSHDWLPLMLGAAWMSLLGGVALTIIRGGRPQLPGDHPALGPWSIAALTVAKLGVAATIAVVFWLTVMVSLPVILAWSISPPALAVAVASALLLIAGRIAMGVKARQLRRRIHDEGHGAMVTRH